MREAGPSARRPFQLEKGGRQRKLGISAGAPTLILTLTLALTQILTLTLTLTLTLILTRWRCCSRCSAWRGSS